MVIVKQAYLERLPCSKYFMRRLVASGRSRYIANMTPNSAGADLDHQASSQQGERRLWARQQASGHKTTREAGVNIAGAYNLKSTQGGITLAEDKASTLMHL